MLLLTPESGIPDDGVIFQLTLIKVPEPMEMVERDGNFSSYQWEYVGKGVTLGTFDFKLVSVGFCDNLIVVRQKIGEDKVPEGEWRGAFRETFPRNDGKGPIGFADASWKIPSGEFNFPFLCEDVEWWKPSFGWANRSLDVRWRWLVKA